MMINRFLRMLIPFYILISFSFPRAFAVTLGPAETISDLRAMISEAASGDILLVTGEIVMDEDAPLTTHTPIRITSQDGETAVLRALRLADASITFSDILLDDSLFVSGISNICLSRKTQVFGSVNDSALSFTGSGTLIIEPGCSIRGGPDQSGISISHSGGEFYSSIEGFVTGGDGENGGEHTEVEIENFKRAVDLIR